MPGGGGGMTHGATALKMDPEYEREAYVAPQVQELYIPEDQRHVSTYDVLADVGDRPVVLLDDILNRVPNRAAPYVGASAFAHKAGLHASAIAKNPDTYEHVTPEAINFMAKHGRGLICVPTTASRPPVARRALANGSIPTISTRLCAFLLVPVLTVRTKVEASPHERSPLTGCRSLCQSTPSHQAPRSAVPEERRAA